MNRHSGPSSAPLVTWAQRLTGTRGATDGDRRVTDGDRRVTDGDRRVIDGDRRATDGDRRATDGDRRVIDGDRRATDGGWGSTFLKPKKALVPFNDVPPRPPHVASQPPFPRPLVRKPSGPAVQACRRTARARATSEAPGDALHNSDVPDRRRAAPPPPTRAVGAPGLRKAAPSQTHTPHDAPCSAPPPL